MTAKSTTSTAVESKPKKKSTIQTVIDDKMLPQLVSGSVWKKVEGESDEDHLARIIVVQTTLVKFMKTVKTALKMFDDELKNQRNIQGTDHLTGVNYFRKPRTPKEGGTDTSLMDDLSFGEDEDEDETSE